MFQTTSIALLASLVTLTSCSYELVVKDKRITSTISVQEITEVTRESTYSLPKLYHRLLSQQQDCSYKNYKLYKQECVFVYRYTVLEHATISTLTNITKNQVRYPSPSILASNHKLVYHTPQYWFRWQGYPSWTQVTRSQYSRISIGERCVISRQPFQDIEYQC